MPSIPSRQDTYPPSTEIPVAIPKDQQEAIATTFRWGRQPPPIDNSSNTQKPVARLTAIKEARPISNEAELVGRQVAIVKEPHIGERGRIAKVVTAERINEEDKTKGHRDVFYTIETDERYITGLLWQDFLQLPRP